MIAIRHSSPPRHRRRAAGLAALVVAALASAGCASRPAKDELVAVAVSRAVTPADFQSGSLKPAELHAVQAAGLRAEDIAAGRAGPVPDWKEQGRRTNFDRVPLPPEHRDRYLVVQGSYMIKCSQ